MPFDEYNKTVLDHFLNPRNTGELRDATVTAEYKNEVCGDHVKLSLKVEGGRITAARTKTFGCAAAIACSSVLTEMVIGRTAAEALAITNEDVVTRLGGLPDAKVKCSLTAEQVLRLALTKARA